MFPTWYSFVRHALIPLQTLRSNQCPPLIVTQVQGFGAGLPCPPRYGGLYSSV